MEEIIQMIIENPNINVGINIPKPENRPCIIICIQENNENCFLKYSTGNSGKIVSKAEFRGAYKVLETCCFTKKWYTENFHKQSKNKSCNYTTIGGIFILLGIAEYIPKGKYRLRKQ